MAEGPSAYAGGLQAHGGVPERGIIRCLSQLRRAAASIPANIAEGCGRGGDKDFARFIQMAMGSASEVEYFLLLSRDLNYSEECQHKQLMEQTVEIKKMLTGLLQTLRGKQPKQSADS